MWRDSRPRSLSRCLGSALLALSLVAGCAPMTPRGPASTARSESTVLLNVRFDITDVRERPPAGVVVSIDEQNGPENRQFAFGPNTRIPGGYADFLVRLDLPPGAYRVRRVSGVNDGVVKPQYDVDVELGFEVRPNATEYLGRIEIRVPAAAGESAAKSPPIVSVVDRYEEDLPDLVRAWPTLRTRNVARRVLPYQARADAAPLPPLAEMQPKAATAPAATVTLPSAAPTHSLPATPPRTDPAPGKSAPPMAPARSLPAPQQRSTPAQEAAKQASSDSASQNFQEMSPEALIRELMARSEAGLAAPSAAPRSAPAAQQPRAPSTREIAAARPAPSANVASDPVEEREATTMERDLAAQAAPQSWGARATNWSGIITILEGGGAMIYRGAGRFHADEGLRLAPGDIVDTGAAAFMQIELADRSVVQFGPATRAMLYVAGAQPSFYVLNGWVKLAGSTANPRVAPGFDVRTRLAEIAANPAVVVMRVTAGEIMLFVESGDLRIAELQAGGGAISVALARDDHYRRKPGARGVVNAGGMDSFVVAMPVFFRDRLPLRIDRYRSKEVLAREAPGFTYADVQSWLQAEPAVRRQFVQRWRTKASEPAFRSALVNNLSAHSEWRPIVLPEMHLPKKPPDLHVDTLRAPVADAGSVPGNQ